MACGMLREKDYSLLEVALETGLETPAVCGAISSKCSARPPALSGTVSRPADQSGRPRPTVGVRRLGVRAQGVPATEFPGPAGTVASAARRTPGEFRNVFPPRRRSIRRDHGLEAETEDSPLQFALMTTTRPLSISASLGVIVAPVVHPGA